MHVTRVAVLWEHLTGYVQSALAALLDYPDVRLFVVQRSTERNARFRAFVNERSNVVCLDQLPTNDTTWIDRLELFAPDIMLVTGNKDRRYLEAARRIHQQGGLVVWASDVPVHSWYRDAYGLLLSRMGRLRAYDAAFVAGLLAANYAHRIGFPDNRIFHGLYSCDTKLYRPIGLERHSSPGPNTWPKVFLFVGQLIKRKGVDILLEAYQRYRQHSSDPWELWCAGSGPMRPMLEGQIGVRILGFLTPEECAQAMAQAGALVLPSRLDHWGVVIHEGACAGLPILASRKCNSAIELVQDGCNGYTFPAEDIDYLGQLLSICADQERARQMGRLSLRLSYRLDPAIFAQLILEHIPTMLHPYGNRNES